MVSMGRRIRAPRTAAVLAAGALMGGFTVLGLRGSAVQPVQGPPPVQPAAPVLTTQADFEQVAERLRPSVVYIRSRQEERTPTTREDFQQDQGPGGGDPFSQFFRQFQFPGEPNGPGGQFRMQPQGPQFPQHAYASGSGVIIRDDGYILTNDHVVEGADRVTVKLQDGREFVGKVMQDFRSDLALVKIPATGLQAAQLANSDNVKVGQWAIAFGAPFGLDDTMTVGVISSLHREQEIGEGNDVRLYPSLLQTDASINPGNSGGPLVDVFGRVVGVNVAIESPSGGNVGIGFAIPANTAKYVMNQLIEHGSVTRGYLGLAPQTLTYQQQQQFGVKQGALVGMISDGTPAARAGFQVGDVITTYNGQPVKDDAELRDMVARTAPGTHVPVVVRRAGGDRTLDVTVGTAPAVQTAANNTPVDNNAQSKLGVSVGSVNDPNVRQQFKLKENVTSGAVILQVAPGSPAAAAGLQAGDVITMFNGHQISSAEDLTAAIRGLHNAPTTTATIRRGGDTILAEINFD